MIQQKRISDPNPFFTQLLTKPYRRQVIVGVHIYPPSISSVLRTPPPPSLNPTCTQVQQFCCRFSLKSVKTLLGMDSWLIHHRCTQASSQYTAASGLYERLTLSHGYLNKKGYCLNSGDCQVFPGEAAHARAKQPTDCYCCLPRRVTPGRMLTTSVCDHDWAGPHHQSTCRFAMIDTACA